MKQIVLIFLTLIGIILTGCTITKIHQSENFGKTNNGIEIESGTENVITNTTGELTGISSNNFSGENYTGEIINQEIKISENTGTISEIETGTITNNANDTLKEKIKMLIEKRKEQNKSVNKLTEEDIQLMEDVLKTIVQETGKK